MFTMKSIANHTKVNYIILLNITNKEVIAMHADELVEFPVLRVFTSSFL